MTTIEQGQAVRTQKALVIAKQKRIAKHGSAWVVPSSSHSGSYVVTTDVVHGMPTWECSCPDYATRGQPCKHVIAVEIVRHREMPDGSTVTEVLRLTYPQNWRAYNLAQRHEKRDFQPLLRDLCSGLVTPPHKGAGRPRMPLADVVFSNAMKVYTTMSGRRADSDIIESHAKGMTSKHPSPNTLFRSMGDPKLTPVLTDLITQAALPLRGVETKFAVDSTGFANVTYVRWYDEKYGEEKSMKTWVKLHAMCGVNTKVVTSVLVTDMSGADCPQFKALVKDTAKNFKMVEVSADMAYLSRNNLAVVNALGAECFIPFKDGTGHGTEDHGAGRAPHQKLWEKTYHQFQYHREAFNAKYHQRSNVESLFSMIKAKFGGSVRSTSPVAQINEVLTKVLCHNVVVLIGAVYELGLEPAFGPPKALAETDDYSP